MTRFLFLWLLFSALASESPGASTPVTATRQVVRLLPRIQQEVFEWALDQYRGTISDTFGRDLSISGKDSDAFDALVSAGPDGWKILLELELGHLGRDGDVVRRINSLWAAGDIPKQTLDGYFLAWRMEEGKRVNNETWALLYAAAHLRCENWHINRRLSEMEILQLLVDDLKRPATASKPLLMTIALLRVKLTDRNDFPGHDFPWHGLKQDQASAVRGISRWWSRHRLEFKDGD